jgi:3-oxoacyl-[acyl-carrier-protein] synthase-3
MDGPEVFRHAVTNISEVIDATLQKAGYVSSDIDWFVPHQANKRILDGAARKLGLDPDRIIVTLDKHANTSAASIPLALSTGVADGRIKRGDLVLLEAMGGGFTWGALLIRW